MTLSEKPKLSHWLFRTEFLAMFLGYVGVALIIASVFLYSRFASALGFFGAAALTISGVVLILAPVKRSLEQIWEALDKEHRAKRRGIRESLFDEGLNEKVGYLITQSQKYLKIKVFNPVRFYNARILREIVSSEANVDVLLPDRKILNNSTMIKELTLRREELEEIVMEIDRFLSCIKDSPDSKRIRVRLYTHLPQHFSLVCDKGAIIEPFVCYNVSKKIDFGLLFEPQSRLFDKVHEDFDRLWEISKVVELKNQAMDAG